MKTFKEYLDEKDELLEEDFLTTAGQILGFSVVGLLAAYGGSLLILGGAKGFKGILAIWDKIKETIKSNPHTFFEKTKKNKLVKQQLQQSEENKRKFNDILNKVYEAIDKKDFVAAKDEFEALNPQYRNMPEIKQTIINEITIILKEPPIWPPSPGNATYKAIRNVLGLPEAKASAMAVKYHTSKTIENEI